MADISQEVEQLRNAEYGKKYEVPLFPAWKRYMKKTRVTITSRPKLQNQLLP